MTYFKDLEEGDFFRWGNPREGGLVVCRKVRVVRWPEEYGWWVCTETFEITPTVHTTDNLSATTRCQVTPVK